MISKKQAWSMWLVVSLFYAYQYILRVAPSVLLSDLMTNFDINLLAFSQLSGIYYLGYSLIHLPLGIILDRFGAKNILPIFIGLACFGTLPLIISNSWNYVILGRFLVGIGSSAAILSLFKIIKLGFNNQSSKMISFAVTIGLLGAIYGGGPLNYLNSLIGFKPSLILLIIIGLLLIIISYFIIPKETIINNDNYFTHCKEVIFNKQVLLLALASGFMVAPLEGFADLWATIFFKKIYLLNEQQAASLPSLIFVGMSIGAPLLSYLAEKINNYLLIILICALLMVGLFSLLLSIKPKLVLLIIILLLIGILCAYQVLAIYHATSYVGEQARNFCVAYVNMIIMLFGYLSHTLLGRVMNSYDNKLISELAINQALKLIPWMLIVAIIILVIISCSKNPNKT